MGREIKGPMYEKIKKYVNKTHGLTVSSLYIAQMK